MRIEFTVDTLQGEFRRNWFTGRAELSVAGATELLQDPLDLGTHYQVSLTKTWQRTWNGHDLVIEAVRPLLFAGFRPHSYRLLVDGKVVAEKRGY